MKKILALLASLFFMFSLNACSGGGGGDDGGDGRTRKTALRIIHGSIDGTPVIARIGDIFLQKSRFAQLQDYVRVEDEEPATVTIERANAPGVILRSLPVPFESETEYTVFVSGEARDDEGRAVLITEPVEQADEGFARIQFLNGLSQAGSLSLRGVDFTTALAREGQSSGYVETVSGPQDLSVVDDEGRVIEELSLVLADRGDVTVLITGSTELNYQIVRVFEDLD